MIKSNIALRKSVSALISVGVLFLASDLARCNAADAPKKDKIKILAVTGGHDYDAAEFDAMFKADSGLEYHHQAHPKALATMSSVGAQDFDVFVLYDMYQPITEDQQQTYARLIRGGKGLVVLHHAMANFQEWPEYERMMGGKFYLKKHVENGIEAPPSGYKHDVDIPVEIADQDHFITKGLADFVIHDETYSRFAVSPAAHVLLRTKHPDSGPVIGWTTAYGKARVVCLQLGHDAKAYANPNYRALVSRAIRWVARQTSDDAAMKPLFNGKDLAGWKTEGNAAWTIQEGILIGRQGPGQAAGDLFTEAEYGDFEMAVTWAMDWPGNSGVWFRYVNGAKAYQADILEWKNPVCWSGSLYCGGKMFIAMNENPALVRRDSWNTFIVRAQKDHIVILLNGHKVADLRDGSSERGKFGIQVHAGAEFAKMAIRIADISVRPLE